MMYWREQLERTAISLVRGGNPGFHRAPAWPPASMEDVFKEAQLVRGQGSRRTGRFCIMSFVALLAGEGHTDAPVTASPVVRHFSIALNDSMPDDQRPMLKPFAPRIIGTNDGCDAERVRLIQHVFSSEVLPHLVHESSGNGTIIKVAGFFRLIESGNLVASDELTRVFLERASCAGPGRESNQMATLAAELLGAFARSKAAFDGDGDWYWCKAVDLLDRLCDVGSSGRQSGATPPRAAQAGLAPHRRGVFERAVAGLGGRLWKAESPDAHLAAAPTCEGGRDAEA